MCEKSSNRSKHLLKRLPNISVIACSDSGNNQCFDFANLVWHLVFIRLTTLRHRRTICKELELHKHPQQNHEVNQENLTRYMSFCLSCPFVENWYKLNQPTHHFWTLAFSWPLFINYPVLPSLREQTITDDSCRKKIKQLRMVREQFIVIGSRQFIGQLFFDVVNLKRKEISVWIKDWVVLLLDIWNLCLIPTCWFPVSLR